MSKKLLAGLAAVAVLSGGVAPLVANAVEVDPWEKAADEFLNNNQGNEPAKEEPKAEEPKKEEPKAEEPKKEEPKKEEPKIDEDYVKNNIDTPTGQEEKQKEDGYLDKAEEKYKDETKKQDTKKPSTGKFNGKKLPKTSAVK